MISAKNQENLYNNLIGVAQITDKKTAMDEIETIIAGGLDDKTIKTATQAITIRDRFRGDWLDADLQRRFATARETAMGFETVKEATEHIDGLEEFSRAQRNDLIAQVKRKFDYKAAEATAALENQRKTDRQAVLDKFIAKDFTNIEADINKTTLTSEEKLSWINKANTRAEAIRKGQKDPFEETDSAVYFDIRRKIATDPDSVTEADLAKLVGKPEGGISTADYEKLLGMITEKEKDPLNSRTAKRGEEYLKLFKRDNAVGWLQLQNDYDKFYTDFIGVNKKPPTDRESEDYLRFLTTKPVRDFWVNDLPDSVINAQLGKLPFEGKQEFVRSAKEGVSTTKWISQWRANPKKLTREVAVHYLILAGRDQAEAIKLAEADGYTQ